MGHKITFVHAPEILYDQNYGTLFSPLWAYTLAAHVQKSWDVEICDTIVMDLDSVGPATVFAFSGINQDLDSIRAAHDELRARYPDATFIVGGPITWSFEQENKLDLLLFFDHVFILDGENSLPEFLGGFEAGKKADKIIRAERFPMDQSRPITFDLIRAHSAHYYGAVVEVSRGCPFLCEFCDIRVLPGNNRANNKDVGLIVEEMDNYYKLGINQFQFACDNFIGDVAWANACVDAILEWKTGTNAEVSIFTWLTINLYKWPGLMEKMRQAGFSILFIGIESVNQNSLLETAKVQNDQALAEAVMKIQSYGFVIAPGFIFGFDSDTETMFDDTLSFMENTGIIGGDPSFLMALPGTPLFARMKQTGRLVSEDSPTVRMKITTNIRYLLDSKFLIKGFLDYLTKYNDARFQYRRFAAHIENMAGEGRYIGHEGGGYGSPQEYLQFQMRNSANRKMLMARIGFLLHKPSNLLTAIRAWLLYRKHAPRLKGLAVHFNYWIYVWTNIGVKYWGLKESDILLHSVGPDFDIRSLLNYDVGEQKVSTETLRRGDEKVAHQSRFTNKALQMLVTERQRKASS